MINIVRNITPSVKKQFVPKRPIETSTCQCLIDQNLICQSCLSRFAILQPSVQKIYTVNNAKMNNIKCPEKPLHVKKYIALKMAIISQQDIKTAPENSEFACQLLGLVTLLGTSKREQHNFGQISVNNFHNMNPKGLSQFEI